MTMNNILIGDRIKNIRLSLGLSMEEFGLKYFETSKGTVSNWEKGRNLPNKKNLKIIAQLGDMTVEDLFFDKKAVGARIRKIRLEKGMTLEEFGKLMGADKGIVSRWENGKSVPKAERLKTVAKLGDMTVEELLNGSINVENELSQQQIYTKDLQNVGYDETKHLTINDFNAVIRRIGKHHLCGYVEIPKGLDIDVNSIDCHGGITFDSKNKPDWFPTNGRYIGFNCAHVGDCIPDGWQGGTYKDNGFVLNEIWNIVQQLQELQEGKQ